MAGLDPAIHERHGRAIVDARDKRGYDSVRQPGSGFSWSNFGSDCEDSIFNENADYEHQKSAGRRL
jgi:hypothetical protein